MNDDKPLHVQVAEALGWSAFEFDSWFVDDDGRPEGKPFWYGHDPIRAKTSPTSAMDGPGFSFPEITPGKPNPTFAPDTLHWRVPHFNTDWSATGPLIHARGIAILKLAPEEGEEWVAFLWDPVNEYTTVHEDDDGALFYLTLDGNSSICATGDTPLLAVCNLILWQARHQSP